MDRDIVMGALSDLRVIDLSTNVAGSFCTKPEQRYNGQILSTLLGVSTDELFSLVECGITGDTPNLDD